MEPKEKENRPAFAGLRGNSPEKMFGNLITPCYILDEAALRHNGEILAGLAQRTGVRVLLAQKAFSDYALYPVLAPYLAGTEASGLYEARLGAEEMPGKEVHVFCGAYREDQLEEMLRYADHLVFNSPRQLAAFGPRAKAAGKSVGLRINPECSTQEGHAIYDPCAPGSRLGTTLEQWQKWMTPDLVDLLDGLHFHTLCEQDADDLEKTLQAVDEKFGFVLPRLKWLNMGGGHHITRPGYHVEQLEKCIRYAQDKWQVQVYLEPGEACALNAGYLATRVLDVLENSGVKLAILDSSAACHMPDVLEMPYQPPIYNAAKQPDEGGQYQHRYRLAGPTCLAGDVIGDYYFPKELKAGDMVIFGDMAIYTTCKNNTFNGMPLPDIWSLGMKGRLEQVTAFGYQDFKTRLGRK